MKTGLAASYAFGVVMLGVALPTPLYPLYQQRLGFSTLLITVIYAVYAVGVIITLVLSGSSSDHYGRRPVLLVGLGCSALSAVSFLAAISLMAIFAGRVLAGLSAGLLREQLPADRSLQQLHGRRAGRRRGHDLAPVPARRALG
ncbi:MAG: MFS transporter [Solirubrobacterales bacterium]|nr:MFS transporter [Solirubrobacterales bacterium]